MSGLELWGIGAFAGFLWGQLWGERSAKKQHKDLGMQLLVGMLSSVQDKRKFVGPEVEITRTETLIVQGEEYILSLRSPAKIDEVAA
tara:strand:- start:355 stop:615 length:261 start_codon:yes stop_codon:yes gene_type:complete